MAAEEAGVNPNLSVAHQLAQSLDEDGRVVPIVWSLSDAVFRAYVDAGKLKSPDDNPTFNEVRDAAAKLKIAYFALCTAVKIEGGFIGSIQLFRTGNAKPIWKDSKNLTVKVGDLSDIESAAATMGRTWSSIMAGDPFKGLPPRPQVKTPDPGIPNQPVKSDPTPPVPKTAAIDPKVLAAARQHAAKAEYAEAINLFREVVDMAPFDAGVRLELASALLASGQPEAAAQAARTGSTMDPAKLELYRLSSRAWLQLGKLDEALEDLNEAMARNPEDPETQLLRGEVFLYRNEPAKALEPIGLAIKLKDSYSARMSRALAEALCGDAKGAVSDIEQAPAASENEKIHAYRASMRLLEKAVEVHCESLRSLLIEAASSKRNKVLLEKANQMVKVTMSLADLVRAMAPPILHADSHQKRLLAQQLLAQAASDCQIFVESGDDGSASEAAISLGEALKAIPAVQQAFTAELAESR